MKQSVMVVDDDPDIALAVEMILGEFGYAVKSLTDATHAYEKVLEEMPDLLILDMLMAGVDGREICRRLKNNPETKDIRVVMISAHPGGKEASEKYRADGFLAKPFSLEELLSAAEEK